MAEEIKMKVIARIRSDFPTKFGIPRQSGLVEGLKSTIVFEPEYRDKNALRGIEQFSHLWLIWQFSEAVREDWSPTVRPPRLGGNQRVGVFATRSPFRPNPVGLTSVKLEAVREDAELGTVLDVSCADLDFAFSNEGNPHYLLVNVAMCGWNSNQATNGGNLPQSMYVDYVRVYQKVKDE